MGAPSLGLTTYTEQLAGYAGMIADLMDGIDIVSARQNDPSDVPYGVAMKRDSDSVSLTQIATPMPNVVLPTGSGDFAYGIVAHAHDQDPKLNGLLSATGLKTDARINLMRRGRIYVNTEDSATEGAAAYMRYSANGGNTQLGALRHDADSSHASKQAGLIWRSTRVDSGIVLLQVDLPAQDAVTA